MIQLFKLLKVLAIVVIASGATLILLPFVYLAAEYVHLSLTDNTDWRIEDYMCTLPQGCDEFIAERRRKREQQQAKPN